MTKKEHYGMVLAYLKEQAPETDSELIYQNPFQLLVAVVLSAQCTDKRVNTVTTGLFGKYPDAATMAKATQADILKYISSVSYPNSKAKYLTGLSKMITDVFHGNVPDNIKDLTKLPGVGRKTANVIQAVAFGKPAIAVDTHVYRVSHRLGLVTSAANTPYKVEMELTKNIPTKDWGKAHFWLLYYGRYTCTALSPKCKQCHLQDICTYTKDKSKTAVAKSNE